MIHATNNTAENEFCAGSRTLSTSGERFDDGSAIELVSVQRGLRPHLLLWNGDTAIIRPEVTHKGIVYSPVVLDDRIWKATQLPPGLVRYGTPGDLFAGTADLFQEYLGFPQREAQVATAWTASTWLADCLPSPPALLVSGPDMNQAVSLFSILTCVSRRPILLAEITRSAMHSLVSSVHPTLLINAPDLSPSMRHFCQTSNYAGVFALGNRGLPSSVPCSKVFFVGSQTDPDWLSGTAVRLVLPISNSQFLPLDPRLQTEIAQRYQPQWLQFRLDHFLRVQTSGWVVESGTPIRAAVRQLQACFPDQAELCGELAEMIQAQDEDARAGNFLDPSPTIIEVLLPFFHSSEKPITVGRLTEFVNTLIRSRGGVCEYDPAEIGTLLSNLSVNRRRKNSGVYISMDPGSSRRVHQLAADYGVGKAIPGCAFCQEAGIKEEQGTASHENSTGHANDAKGSEGGEGGDGVCKAREGRDPECP